MNPHELLEELLKLANARKRQSLQIIHDICREQHERGSRDFSIACIGRLSEKRGGPKTQPIRNKSGEEFRALINAWATFTGGASRKVAKPKENFLSEVLRQIPDAAVRAVMGNALAENTKLKGQLNALKSQTNIVIDQRLTIPSTTYQSTASDEIFEVHNGLTEIEVAALQHAISGDFLADQGWIAEPNGRVKNASGRSLYKAGYVTAIQKILNANKKAHTFK